MNPLVVIGALLVAAAAMRSQGGGFVPKHPPVESDLQEIVLGEYRKALYRGESAQLAVKKAQELYRRNGGSDVAFIARLNAFDPQTWSR